MPISRVAPSTFKISRQTLLENLGIFHRPRSFSQAAFEALDHGLGYMYSDPTRKNPGNQIP
jgi:hypothetical protein